MVMIPTTFTQSGALVVGILSGILLALPVSPLELAGSDFIISTLSGAASENAEGRAFGAECPTVAGPSDGR